MAKRAIDSNSPFPRQFPRELLVMESGRHVYLEDREGVRYLDFGAGIAVNALGYGRRDLARIAARQMRKLVHVSNLFGTDPSLQLARQILADANQRIGRSVSANSVSGTQSEAEHRYTAVHFGNSGTEANEAAIKYARAYGRRVRGIDAPVIVAMENAFHGRTMGALAASGRESYKEPFRPMLPGFRHVPMNDVQALTEAIGADVVAVMVEPVQGEGGLDVLSPEAVDLLARLRREQGLLVIADEVQTGLGRMGTLFGSEAFGLQPDIITLSKPLAGGLPLSATIISAAINDSLEPGDHGTTFGGGPATCAVGLKVWNIVRDPGFLAGVQARAEELRVALEDLVARGPSLGGPLGRGLLTGIRVDSILPKQIVSDARDRRLLLLTSGADVIRIAPPLVIRSKEIQTGVGILAEVLGATGLLPATADNNSQEDQEGETE